MSLSLETLETRVVPSGVRTIDGSGNNATHADWGQAATALLRISPVAYPDGIGAPSLSGTANPSARLASDNLSNQADPLNPTADIATVNQNMLSDFGYTWGQFIDHDMDLTPDGGDSFPITVPPNDPMGPSPIPFTRSQYAQGTGVTTPRQQVTNVTAYLDLSQVYGSSTDVEMALRTGQFGLLKTSPGNMLPYNSHDYFSDAQIAALNMANGSGFVTNDKLFAAGDVRANENIELTALQTLFMRNHNRLAGLIYAKNPTWTDEQIFQEARRLNIADEEIITYNQWLPDLLGAGAVPTYSGYKKGVNASISTEFSTIGFRFGHSMLDNEVERHGGDGQDINIPGGASISLAFDFFNPTLLNPAGVVDPLTGQTSTDVDPILKANSDGIAQETDLLAVDAVRNLLFGNGAGGDDLIARDIQRARDHGIGTYNQVRVAYHLPAVTSFSQISSNPTIQAALQATYGVVDNVDPFQGGLAETHVAGSDLGPLFQKILVDQFTRLRDGDRFFYLNEGLGPIEQGVIAQGNSLAKMIELNTHVTNLQSDVMVYKASISGTVFFDLNHNGVRDGQEFGIPGISVQLHNDNGDVVATTVTDLGGNYTFNQLSTPSSNAEIGSGLSATGNYNVTVTLPSSIFKLTGSPGTTLFSVGGTNVTGQNFGFFFNSSFPTGAISGLPGRPITVTLPNNAATSGLKQERIVSAAGDSQHGMATKSDTAPSLIAARQAPAKYGFGEMDDFFSHLKV